MKSGDIEQKKKLKMVVVMKYEVQRKPSFVEIMTNAVKTLIIEKNG